jgi:hypothetical protein
MLTKLLKWGQAGCIESPGTTGDPAPQNHILNNDILSIFVFFIGYSMVVGHILNKWNARFEFLVSPKLHLF